MNTPESSTVIGKSVVVRGDISGKEDLFLDGDIQGSINLQENRLTLGPDALIVADVTVRDLVVFGKLTGNIYATGRVELRQSASVIGDITAGRLSIEESAMLKGHVELKAGEPQPTSASRKTSPVASSEPLVLQPKS